MKKEIQTRTDVFLLVDNFYKKVRNDALLGPIFNRTIDDCPTNLQLLTDFWETNLFLSQSLKAIPF